MHFVPGPFITVTSIKCCPHFLFHFLSAHLIDYLHLMPPSPSSRGTVIGTSLGVVIEKKITSDVRNPNMRDRRRDGEMAIAELLQCSNNGYPVFRVFSSSHEGDPEERP